MRDTVKMFVVAVARWATKSPTSKSTFLQLNPANTQANHQNRLIDSNKTKIQKRLSTEQNAR